MKPIYLKMTAFGSYCSPAEIDFTKLYDKGIFLISGKTGGGKTTILDAMCAALYGKATGSERAKDWKQLRCGNAPNSVDTELDYIFSLGEMKYRFYRRWHVPNTRNGEFKITDTENACYRAREGEDWELLASGNANAVNKTAEDILKLSQNQFVKVIMLPQGEFRELLIAKSDDKTEIFKKLFDTERWERITDRITEEFRAAERSCAEHTARIMTALQAAQCETYDSLREKTDACQAELEALQKQREQNDRQTQQAAAALKAAEATASLFAEREQLQGDLTKWEAQAADFETLQATLSRSRTLRGVLSEYDLKQAAAEAVKKQTTASETARAAAQTAQVRWQQAEQEAAALPALEEQQRGLLTRMAGWKDLASGQAVFQEATRSLQKNERALADNEGRLETLAKEKADTEASLQKGSEYLESCRAATEKWNGVMQQRHALEQLFATTKEYEEKDGTAQTLRRQIAAAESSIREGEAEYEALQKTVLSVEQAIIADKAYSLAVTLEEGAPCPVCGATHHPRLAAPAGSTPTAEELAACRRSAEKHAKSLETARADHTALVTKYRLTQNDLQTLLAKAGGSFDRTAVSVKAELDAVKEEEASLRKLSSQTEKAQKRMNELERRLTVNREDTQNVTTHCNNLRIAIASDRQKLQTLRERLAAQDMSDFAALDRKLTEAAAQLARTEAQIKSRSDALTAASSRLSSAQATLRAAEEALTAARGEYTRREESFLAQCAALGVDADADIRGGVLPDKTEKEYDRRIAEYNTRLSFARTRIAQLSESLKEQLPPPLDALRADHAAALAEGHRISQTIGNATQRLKFLNDTASTTAEEQKALDKLQKTYDTAERLNRLFSGRNELRTSIHEYVISLKMDEVLTNANLYLKRLSGGQYEMYRKEPDSIGGRARRQGLDIEIFDGNVGKVRPVSTLSGGEMFLASLSLAFGLSDVVQCFAGGIHLDSLFIDEGFGSLDSETLDIVMEAITQLRENKLLGIISHVSELKERIPYGIEVLKSHDGSQIKVDFFS